MISKCLILFKILTTSTFVDIVKVESEQGLMHFVGIGNGIQVVSKHVSGGQHGAEIRESGMRLQVADELAKGLARCQSMHLVRLFPRIWSTGGENSRKRLCIF